MNNRLSIYFSKLNALKKSDFFKKSLSTLIFRILGVTFQFLILLILTNSFSEKLVGQFTYINTVLILMSSVCLLGMNESFLQFSGKFEANKTRSLIQPLYVKKVFLLLLSYVIISLFYIFLSRIIKISFFKVENTLLFNKVFLALFFFSLSLLNFQVIRAVRKLKLSEFFRNVIRYGLILFFVSVIIVFDLKSSNLLNVFLITFLLIALITSKIAYHETNKLKKDEESKIYLKHKIRFKDILYISIPMSISSISLLLMQSFDTIMIENYLNLESVAFYSVCVKLTFIVGIMQLTINSVIAPDISKYWFQKKKDELKTLINKSIKFNFIITSPLIILILIFPKRLLSLFGGEYVIGRNTLIILLLGQIVNSFCGSVGLYLNMTGRQKIFLFSLLTAAGLNIILNIFLIPLYGIEGAAISTSLSLITWNFIGVIYVFWNDKILLIVNKLTFK